ncbi:MAG: response regulator transcription factor [Desulfovibrionaceae bacterium]|jgi:DNA-binding LytR/AlgR family response regulator|nr:response regulator transcription factor [Desulfovibrionaceae bacterium]
MPPLKTLILHPEPDIRHALRRSLDRVDFVQVLGEAVTAGEALELLEVVPYGVLFTGVELPGGATGLELAQMLMGRKNHPAMVYIAPDESLAFQAFELGATDYLLYPYGEDRFARTVERLRQFKAHFKLIPLPEADYTADDDEDDDFEQTLKVPLGDEEQDQFLAALRHAWDDAQRYRPLEIEKLAIQQDGRTILIPYDQVIFVEAYEDYSYVHTATQKFLTSYRLKVLEDRLRLHRFFRVHRKYLVNLNMVTEIASLPGSNFMLRTVGRTRIELPISRRRITELKTILGL